MLPTASAMSRPQNPELSRPRRAFTLVELLVVIGINAVLIAILMPALAAARRQGQLVRCQSNLRQIALGFFQYAHENKERFPATLGASGTSWQVGVVNLLAPDGLYKGHPLFTCPRDDDDALLSYSMNIWTSSAIDPSSANKFGTLWGPAPRKSSQVILVIEAWSWTGHKAPITVGARGDTPGKRFGAGGGVPLINTFLPRFGVLNCEIDYSRHRPRNHWAQRTQPGGIVNIAYVDGHVEAKSESDLADRDTGLSRLDSLWSPLDEAQNAAAAAALP